MDAEEKRLLRTIVRKVHPDLFTGHPNERACNSESLKLLNAYLDGMAREAAVEETKLQFWISGGGEDSLIAIRAELPAWGSLGPLFYAFDLIDEEQLLSGFGQCKSGSGGANILSWLGGSIDQAIKAADEHDILRGRIRELRTQLEDRFRLAALSIDKEFSAGLAEQRRQIEALETLESCLAALTADDPNLLEGLSFNVYHRDSSSLAALHKLGLHSYSRHKRLNESFVADDGVLHVVAERSTIQAAVASLDLNRARILTQVACFWTRRSRDLTNMLQDLLGVQKVWCDTRTETASQQFVLWAGEIFSMRPKIDQVLRGQKFRFSLLVHCDKDSPQLEFRALSSTLQVRVDTPAEDLISFIAGSTGSVADIAAADAAAAKKEEEAILEQVRQVLGLRHMIRVCSSSQHSKVISAAKRLLQHADKFHAAGINLAGASLAIDDCYEVWESGFISIPFDFELQDLQPKLRGLLGSAQNQPSQESPSTSRLTENGLSSPFRSPVVPSSKLQQGKLGGHMPHTTLSHTARSCKRGLNYHAASNCRGSQARQMALPAVLAFCRATQPLRITGLRGLLLV